MRRFYHSLSEVLCIFLSVFIRIISRQMMRYFRHSCDDGFMATIAVILLAFGLMAFVLAVNASAYDYADSVERRELRIQAGNNAQSCARIFQSMVELDNYIDGNFHIPYLDCDIQAENDMEGHVVYHIATRLVGVGAQYSGNVLY